jgi:hypothetical protein
MTKSRRPKSVSKKHMSLIDRLTAFMKKGGAKRSRRHSKKGGKRSRRSSRRSSRR